MHVLGHDRDALGVNGAKVRVLKEANKVGLSGLLQGEHGLALETEVALELLRDLLDESLEGELANKKVSLRRGKVELRLTDFWNFLISRRATVPGRYRCGFFMLPLAAVLRAALWARCFRGALAPAVLRAVCLVRAIGFY